MVVRSNMTLSYAHLPNTCQYTAETPRGPYLIQAAWPLCWSSERLPPANGEKDIPVSSFYLVDSNAYFFTAVEISRRLESLNGTRSIIVGVGYPPTKFVYDFRRGPDLTPPSHDGTYTPPLDKEGKPRTDLRFGEADVFLDFVQNEVMRTVEKDLFPAVDWEIGRKCLFGHSYGGLFSFNALFTRPALFDFIVAASPSISWSEYSIMTFQEEEFRKGEEVPEKPPRLLLTWGSSSGELERRDGESKASFEGRKKEAEEPDCGYDARAMAKRLEEYRGIGTVATAEFPGWGHGGAAVVGLQRAMMWFLLEMD